MEDNIVSSKDSNKQGNNRQFFKGALFGALAVLLVGLLGIIGWNFISGGYTEAGSAGKASEAKLQKLGRIIDQYYLYDDKIDEQSLIDGILSGYTAGLDDPYTTYYDKEKTKALLESSSGRYIGIGAVLTVQADTSQPVITEVYRDSPAEKAGLKSGDILFQVDDHAMEGESLSDIVAWIKGEEGTQVKLHVYRGEQKEEKVLTVVRDNVTANTIYHSMEANQTGYLRVVEFDDVTYDQFKEALDDLENQGMQGLVIDLRGNPGGNLDTAVDMLRLLLPKGTIVSTRDKNGQGEEYTCDGKHEFTKPLSVLVDGNSASAAEIFSSAIQDYGVGEIVGETTYGKGVAQSVINLGDGTYMKLTTSEWLTSKGKNINKKGVIPDVEVKYQEDAENPEADNQLDKALEVVLDKINITVQP